jgi:hypothetical protein
MKSRFAIAMIDEVHYSTKTNAGFGPKNEFQLIGISGSIAQK